MEKEVVVICLIYIERLIIREDYKLTSLNWRKVMFLALILGSKIWDDLAMENKDLATLWPPITLKRVNQLERRALEALKYNVKVPSSLYLQ